MVQEKEIYEYNLEELINLGQIIDKVEDKECIIKVRPLYSKEPDQRFERVKKKYLLIGNAPNGNFEVIVSNKYSLIPNYLAEKIKEKINADQIKINYWSGWFLAEMNSSDVGIYVVNSYVKNSSFKVMPTIKTNYKNIEFFMKIPISFSKEHIGSSKLLKAFLNNLEMMLEKIKEHKDIILTEINKEIPQDIKDILEEKIDQFFNRKIKNLYYSSDIKTFKDFIYFFSEKYREAIKNPNLRTEILRQEIIDLIFKLLPRKVLSISFESDSEFKASSRRV